MCSLITTIIEVTLGVFPRHLPSKKVIKDTALQYDYNISNKGKFNCPAMNGDDGNAKSFWFLDLLEQSQHEHSLHGEKQEEKF